MRSGSNVAARKADIWCPRDVANPVSVPFERLFLHPGLRIFAVTPDLHEVVAPGAGEAFDRLILACGLGLARGRLDLLGSDERAGLHGWGPGDGVTANGVSVEDVGTPLTVI